MFEENTPTRGKLKEKRRAKKYPNRPNQKQIVFNPASETGEPTSLVAAITEKVQTDEHDLIQSGQNLVNYNTNDEMASFLKAYIDSTNRSDMGRSDEAKQELSEVFLQLIPYLFYCPYKSLNSGSEIYPVFHWYQ